MHPDMIPLGAPEKMRKVIEENFKLVNQAYEVLSDSTLREKYDSELFGKHESTGYKGSNREKNAKEWLDPYQLNLAIKKLDKRIQNIKLDAEKRCSRKISQAKDEVEYAIRKIGNNVNINNLWNIRGKDTSVGITFLIFGFLLMAIPNFLVGLIGFCTFLASVIEIIRGTQVDPKFNQNLINARELASKLDSKIKIIEALKDKEIILHLEEIKEKLNYFQQISAYEIADSFFNNLSPEDQTLLLVAIQKNNV
jgi:hypothetical protein